MNDVMELDIVPNSRNRQIDIIPNQGNTNIDFGIDSNFMLLDTDMHVNQNGIEMELGTKKVEINIEIGDGKSGKVFTDNVYFKDDVLAAGEYTQVGNFNKGKEESVPIAMKGKTLADFIRLIFTKELQPSKTDPSVTIIFSQAGSYEVGNKVTPSYTANFNPGSYTYGPATGVTVKKWSIEDSDGNTSTSKSDSFNSFVVKDDTNYYITAKADHTEGSIALTNLGNESIPEVKISEGSKSKKSGSVTGYRSFFYGVLENDTLDTNVIRSLHNGGNYNGEKKFTILANEVSSPKKIVIAIPSNTTRSGIKQVLLSSAFDTDITAQYVLQSTQVNVEGANGYTSIPYNIYIYEPALIDPGEIHAVTLG